MAKKDSLTICVYCKHYKYVSGVLFASIPNHQCLGLPVKIDYVTGKNLAPSSCYTQNDGNCGYFVQK
jgi:hypothetical protein